MHQSKLFNRTTLASFVMSCAILVSGCAATGSHMLGSSADPRLTNNDTAQFFSKSGYQACAAAAGVGVLACLASNSSNKAACAIAAGIAACGVAMGANYYLDDRRSKYSDTNQRLQVMTQDIQEDTQRVVQRTQVAQRVIVDDKAKLAQIQKDLSSKRLDIAQANKDLATIDSNIALLNKDLTNMKAKADEYAKAAQKERAEGAGNKVNQMDREIERMNQKVALLENEIEGLFSQRSAITLG
ncbi:hypothetical protein TOI97_12110 [Denitrificimonas sp. JX-1]|uniref:Lipoprotein n=1 Tax=Denitrificimonas halotolerans TaxID=3098930 RepID=A0ABU5GUW5_9GAMM|nr:hypothetical protein [Denitrificimonas sp. JX-1]MDY7220307.1 hypothetical protein [Denitrificimonas sp. JX-1]